MTGRQDRRDDKTSLYRAWYGRLRGSHHPQEETDVLPSPCDRMEYYHPDAPAPFDQAPSHRLGDVESGHGPGPVVCADGRQCVPGSVAGPQRKYRAPAVARILL